MDAIGVATVSIGGFLLYASIKGLHPWSLFTQTLGSSAPQAPASVPPNSVVTPALYSGPINPQTGLPQGTSVAGGGTGAIR